jgi:hypothetical protein
MATRAAKPKPKADPLVREEDGQLYALVDLVVERPEVSPTKVIHIPAGHLIPPEFQHHRRHRKP